jgi:anti-anti-sigma factor
MEAFSFMFDPAAKSIKCAFNRKMDTLKSNEAAEDFKTEFESLLTSGVSAEELNICFDLSEVDYISSSFLRLCISSAREIKKGNFSIINTGPEIMKVFKIAGLDGMLSVS